MGGNFYIYIKEIWNLPIATILICFLIYFIGGYFLYSSFYAAIGAAVDNETDSQQFLLPIIMPLILGVYIGFFTVINDPHGTMATVFSMVPLTSPIVMMMRIPFGVPWWRNRHFDDYSIYNIFWSSLVCCQNLSCRNINVWQKTNLERIAQMVAILIFFWS